MWKELQAVRAEISELEKEKRHISEMVKTLVVSKGYYSNFHYHQFVFIVLNV